MLRMPDFAFRMPETIEDAAEIVANEKSCRIVAGGTDLYPNMKRRHQQAETVVSLRKIGALFGVENNNGSGMRIGAMTTLTDVAENSDVRERFPHLAEAAGSIASPVLRNMGTIGGNLCLDTRCTYYNQNEEWRRSIDYCMKEEGSTCWVAPGSPRCWAISASDTAPILCALDATVRLVSNEGSREIPVRNLFNDDGIEYLTKRPNEILTDVVVPDPGASKTAFRKLRRRGSIDFSVLSVAVRVDFDGDTVRRADIYLGAVGSHPIQCEESEAALVGKKLDAETIDESARVSRKAGTPLNNTDFVPQWRSKVIEKYLHSALTEIAGG